MDTSKAIRGLVGGATFSALMAALAQLRTWQELVAWLVSSDGAALATFGLIEGIDSGVKAFSRTGVGLNPDVKFYSAIVLGVLLPCGATALSIWLGFLTFNYQLVVTTIATAYTVSQMVHWEGGSQLHEAVHPPTSVS